MLFLYQNKESPNLALSVEMYNVGLACLSHPAFADLPGPVGRRGG